MADTDVFDVIALGSGIGGLAAALAAHEHGLRPILIEKSDQIGGTTADSYGLIWVGGNHLMRRTGQTDSRDDIVQYMRFLGGGELSEERMLALVDHSPEVMVFYESCGIPFRLVGGIVDHYLGVAAGARSSGRTLEAELISGHELGAWRDKVRTPKDAPYFVTAEEQYAWGGINRYSTWDQDMVRDRRAKDMRGKGVGLVTHFTKALLARGVSIRMNAAVGGLTVEDDRVTGVRMSDGTLLRSKKGVVLATGGYEWNADLIQDFDPIPRLQPLSPPSSTGDGLIMGAEIGAAIRRIQNNLNLMLGFYLVPDEPSREPIQCMAGISEMCSPHTIVVNKAGQRFADESYFQSVVPALRKFDTLKHDYANLPCFLIFDRQFTSSYALAHLPAGTAVPSSVARADTVADLAVKRHRSRGARLYRHALQHFRGGWPRRGFPTRRDALAAGLPFDGTARQSKPGHARPAAVLRHRIAPEPGHHIGGAAGRCQRSGAAPAAAPDPRSLCIRRGGGAHRAGRRISGWTESRLRDDVQPALRQAHAEAVTTAPGARSPSPAGPRSRPLWR